MRQLNLDLLDVGVDAHNLAAHQKKYLASIFSVFTRILPILLSATVSLSSAISENKLTIYLVNIYFF